MKPSKSNAHVRDPAETHSVTLGQRLVQARTARGITIEDMARQMNLSVSSIRALETDNHRGLAGPTFIRGYLRTYARITGLPAAELISTYDREHPRDEEVHPATQPRRRAVRWIAPVVMLALGALAIALLAGLVSLIGQHFFSAAEKAQTIVQPVLNSVAQLDDAQEVVKKSDDAPMALPVPLKPVSGAETLAEAAPLTPGAVPQTAPPASTVPLSASPVEGAAADTASPPSSADAPMATPGRGALVLNFSADCWVSVRDASGTHLYRGLKRAGSELSVEGAAPLKVVLGNTRAVTVRYNGADVPVNNPDPTQVMTLTLGSP